MASTTTTTSAVVNDDDLQEDIYLFPKTEYPAKLPTELCKPIHYSLFFDVSLKEPFNFKASEFIFLSLSTKQLKESSSSPKNKTTQIWLHSIDLIYDSIAISFDNVASSLTKDNDTFNQQEKVDRKWIKATGVNIYPDCERISANFNTEDLLSCVNDYNIIMAVLKIKFSAKLSSSLAGFYKSSYKVNGEERYMATTQFEATDARRAFPSFDEPNLKASFSLTLNYPDDRIAISNMKAIEETKITAENKKQSVFATTPIMSTYLLAIIVGDFDYVEQVVPALTAAKAKQDDILTAVDSKYAHVSERKVECEHSGRGEVVVRVYTPIGKKEQGNLPLSVVVNSLQFYERYFGFSFPLEKVDLLAIPDFAAGAMENWGAITYREARLLIDHTNSTAIMKQRNLRTINHELAHMWFGNLVTMDWWTHLWLNEGFARYMEHIAVDKFFPEFDIWTQFGCEVYARALSLDALQSSHAIEIDVNYASEINEIFDSISYAKGASVIKMLSTFLGEDLFRAGLKTYLREHLYANGETCNLWEALSKTTKQLLAENNNNSNSNDNSQKEKVEELMTCWTKQVGFPLVTVTMLSSTDTEIELKLQQSRFGLENDDSLWKIPIAIKTNDVEETTNIIMIEKEMIVKVAISSKDNFKWFKLNWNHSSFFRTQYVANDDGDGNFEALCQSATSLPPLDRMGLLNDTYALVVANKLSTVKLLELLKEYKSEENYAVFAEVCTCLSAIIRNFDEEEDTILKNLKDFVITLIKPVVDRVGWQKSSNDSHLSSLFRATAISLLTSTGEKGSVEEAVKRYKAGKVAADLRSTVYKAVVSNGSDDAYHSILQRYHSSDMAEEKRQCLVALGATSNEQLLRDTLAFAIDHVRGQDISFPLVGVSRNAKGRYIAWEWLKREWPNLKKRFGGGQNFIISSIINSIVPYFHSTLIANEIEDFFNNNPLASANRSISQSLECVRRSAKWNDIAEIKAWFDKQQ